MLYEVHKKLDDGTEVKEVVYSEGAYKINPEGIRYCNVSLFKYKYEGQVLPPTVIKAPSGKTYIVPVWQEVHPQTTIKDIEWIKPQPPKQDPIKFEVTGSNGDKYNTVFNPNTNNWKCNCMGYSRLKDKDKGCKHIQQKIESLNK